MDKDKIIILLNKDLEDEHAAIIQYLSHAYAIGEGEMACEIEAISREEMRHLDWLAEAIVELGGTPSLVRGKMLLEGKFVAKWMENNVSLEDGAIAQYEEHIKLTSDPRIKRLLRRILSDEEAHRDQFKRFVEKAKVEGVEDLRGIRQDKVIRLLNWAIEHEYTVILQYMFHSYMTTNKAAKKELEDQAINEMQHLSWLAEAIVDIGGSPMIEHTEIDQSIKNASMLRADIEIESEVAIEYDRAAKEFADPNLKKLLFRMRDHELYHDEIFSDLLKGRKRQIKD